jgi:hypothetical protein
MLRWLISIWEWLFHSERKQPAQVATGAPLYKSNIISIRRYTGNEDPPPLYWKACHPSTMKRFKAEMTCSRGHGMVLKQHAVYADGRVFPSVVCLEHECNFHEFVRLDTWDFGPLQ